MADPLTDFEEAAWVMTRAQAWRSLLAVLLALWATDIGPESLAPQAQAVQAQELQRQPLATVGQAKARPAMPQFITPPQAAIDREAFIASFQRQARSEALPCLLQWRLSPASLHIAATLLKSGQMKNLRAVAGKDALPDCLTIAVGKMNFVGLTAALVGDGQDLQWRIDW